MIETVPEATRRRWGEVASQFLARAATEAGAKRVSRKGLDAALVLIEERISKLVWAARNNGLPIAAMLEIDAVQLGLVGSPDHHRAIGKLAAIQDRYGIPIEELLAVHKDISFDPWGLPG